MSVTEPDYLHRSLWGQLWRYGATGVLNTALGYGLILSCVYGLETGVIIANVVGYGAGWILSYSMNKRWTFGHRGQTARTAAVFCALVAGAFVANLTVTLALSQIGIAYPVAQIIGAVVYSATVFVGMKWMVFK